MRVTSPLFSPPSMTGRTISSDDGSVVPSCPGAFPRFSSFLSSTSAFTLFSPPPTVSYVSCILIVPLSPFSALRVILHRFLFSPFLCPWCSPGMVVPCLGTVQHCPATISSVSLPFDRFLFRPHCSLSFSTFLGSLVLPPERNVGTLSLLSFFFSFPSPLAPISLSFVPFPDPQLSLSCCLHIYHALLSFLYKTH